MRDLIDSFISPLLVWLQSIYDRLHDLSVPLSRPLNLSNYLGYFNILGGTWTSCISTMLALSVIYFILWVIVSNIGLISRFKTLIKWW